MFINYIDVTIDSLVIRREGYIFYKLSEINCYQYWDINIFTIIFKRKSKI